MKLSPNELKIFENLLIQCGCVLNFNYDDFINYVYEITNIDVGTEEYKEKIKKKYNSSSKGNTLKYFIHNESEKNVFDLLKSFIEYIEENKNKIEMDKEIEFDSKRLEKAKQILSKNDDILDEEKSNEKKINDLIKDINHSIEKGEPVFTLDRLHTLLGYYFNDLCDKHEIKYNKKSRLDEKVKKYLNSIDVLDSDLSQTIVKSSISMLSKFNEIRNNKSYAHPNEILNSAESLLIYRNIVNIYKFIRTIENEFYKNYKSHYDLNKN